MLSKLHIKNIALIPELELDFCSQLNVMSGETGAGKSIVVDSLLLLLGGKYDKTILRYGETSGYVEGVFEISAELKPHLREYGLEDDDILIVSRKFFLDGKNEIRVGGKLFSLTMLKSLMTEFVDIYGQNEYQSLSKQSEHLKILDYFLKDDLSAVLNQLSLKHREYRSIKKQLDELGDLSERAKNIDILKYQIEEISASKIKSNEEEEIFAKRRIILSSEKIATALGQASSFLSEGEVNASELVSSALHALSGITDVKEKYSEVYERLHSAFIELDDIAGFLEDELESMNFDEKEIDRIEKRYDFIMNMKRKYGAFDKMQKFFENAEMTLHKLENCDKIYDDLSGKRDLLVKEIFGLCSQLSELRRSGAKIFEKNILEELSELGMEHSKFEVIFQVNPKFEESEKYFSEKGFDNVEFYLSPNVGQPLKPLIKIISGGEMSRFMLALKVATSRLGGVPTLIFDEIDTGISGIIGQAVAKKLAKISRGHQILCVTHLSQIASMADNHYYIKKVSENETTITEVNLLDQIGMVEEISRLSGSRNISSQASKNAEEMKEWSNAFKNSL